ncbi:hypothetical protein ACOME3_000540 [Neoechinorhynchus agilis]
MRRRLVKIIKVDEGKENNQVAVGGGERPPKTQQALIDQAISQAAQAHLKSKDTVQYPSIQSNSNCNSETYLDLPVKSWPHVITISSSPCDNSGVTISTGNYDSTFQVSGQSSDIGLSDREEFEARFRCQILFFLKSTKSGKSIPRAVLKANVDTRNELAAQRCFFKKWKLNSFPMIYLIRTIFISRDAADVKSEAAGHRNVRTNLSFVRTVLKISVAKNAPNRRNYVPTAVKQVIAFLQGNVRNSRSM